MTKNNLYHGARKLRATGALVLALALSTFPAAFSRAVNAQTPAKANAQTPAKAATRPAGESKGGQKEGIKVHGHWTIDVHNPDGTLVSHHEIDNSLASAGQAILPRVLGNFVKFGELGIKLFGLDSAHEPCDGGPVGGPFPCSIETPTSLGTGTDVFKTMTVNVPFDSNDPLVDKLVVSGNAQVIRDSTIGSLSLQFSACSATATDCHLEPALALTFVQLTPLPPSGSCPANTQCTVNLVAGQIVQVKVVVSFS
jgi:hypothetical protein